MLAFKRKAWSIFKREVCPTFAWYNICKAAADGLGLMQDSTTKLQNIALIVLPSAAALLIFTNLDKNLTNVFNHSVLVRSAYLYRLMNVSV